MEKPFKAIYFNVQKSIKLIFFILYKIIFTLLM
jgi:hypothetical protein